MILQIKSLLVLLLVKIGFSIQAQDSTSYVAPVTWPIKLSGTFGELRPGHFHMGIDIKSPNGAVGHGIRSIEDGYVSRIKVSSGGYGKVLYVIHPTGHESVYAHLQLFIPEIETLVKDEQYKLQSHEIDLDLFPDQILVKKGQFIGQMGMTGRTFGPHLHFELRDKWSGLGLNPLAYGIKVEDQEAPRLYQIVIYELDHQDHEISKKKYEANNLPETISVYSENIGIGIKAYDRMDGVRNLNGVHSIKMDVDGQHKFSFNFDTLDHSKQRFINAHKDFELFQKDAAYVNRMFKQKGNDLDIYKTASTGGVISMVPNQHKSIHLCLEDSFDNLREIDFNLKREAYENDISYPIYNHLIQVDSATSFRLDEMSLDFKPGNVYENIPAKITTQINDSTNTKIYRIHHRNDPVHSPYQISIHLPGIDEKLRPKYYIAGLNSKGEPTNLGGRWIGDTLTTRLNSFGDFKTSIDTIPPSIEPKTFKNDLSKAIQMSFTIKDDFPRAWLNYSATVDGAWILMEYDAKRDLLTHHFDGRIGPGQHRLEIELEDRNGNVAKTNYSFTR